MANISTNNVAIKNMENKRYGFAHLLLKVLKLKITLSESGIR
jgi:hypothetical protein